MCERPAETTQMGSFYTRMLSDHHDSRCSRKFAGLCISPYVRKEGEGGQGGLFSHRWMISKQPGLKDCSMRIVARRGRIRLRPQGLRRRLRDKVLT